MNANHTMAYTVNVDQQLLNQVTYFFTKTLSKKSFRAEACHVAIRVTAVASDAGTQFRCCMITYSVTYKSCKLTTLACFKRLNICKTLQRYSMVT